MASWNSEGDGDFLDWDSEGIGRAGGGGETQFGISNAWGGGSALSFQSRKTVKASLEIVDLITSPVCKSSANQLLKQDKARLGRC